MRRNECTGLKLEITGILILSIVVVMFAGCEKTPSKPTEATILMQDISYDIVYSEDSEGNSLFYNVRFWEAVEDTIPGGFPIDFRGREVNSVSIGGSDLVVNNYGYGVSYFHLRESVSPTHDSLWCEISFPEGVDYAANIPACNRLELVGIPGYEVIVEDSITIEVADWGRYTSFTAYGYEDEFFPYSFEYSDSTITLHIPADRDTALFNVLAHRFDTPEYRVLQDTSFLVLSPFPGGAVDRVFEKDNLTIRESFNQSYSRKLMLIRASE